MTQHDQVIDNATGLAVRTDINSALAALFSTSSGSVEPVVKTAGQLWFDTGSTPNRLKVYASGAWVTLAQLPTIDMGTGYRTGPDRWVVNENSALTGRDYLSVHDNTGVVQIQDTLNLLEVDGSIRGKINVGIGADAGTIICVVYDASGTEVNRWTMIPSAFRLKNGGYQLHNGTAIRAQLSADMVGATGRLNLESYTSGGVVDSTAVLTAQGLALNTVGDFYISRSGVVRANFGWDGTLGAYLRHRTSGGAIDGEIDINANGASLPYGEFFLTRAGVQRAIFGWDATLGTLIRQRNPSAILNAELAVSPFGASLAYGDYRLVTSGNVLRAAMIAERVAAPGKIDLISYTSAAVADGQLRVDASGVTLPLAGDYDIERSGVKRGSFGWDTGAGAYIRSRDAAGALTNQAQLSGSGFELTVASNFRVRDAGIVRASFGWNATDGANWHNRDTAGTIAGEASINNVGHSIKPGSGDMRYRILDSTGVERVFLNMVLGGGIESNWKIFDNLGAQLASVQLTATTLKYNNSLVHTDASIQSASGQAVVDFPVGTYVLAHTAQAAEPNRNVDIPVRLTGTGTIAYQHSSGGTQLTGTWRSRGSMIVTASPAILCQRIS